MPSQGARRGVLMTATARKPRASWRDEEDDEDEISNLGSDDDVTAAKASQLEWETITREVREERRKKHAETHFAHGNRDTVTGYDDVADDAVEPDEPVIPPREEEEEAEQPDDDPSEATGAREAAAPRRAEEGGPEEDGERALPPEGAITAGQNDDKSRRTRGGKKKTGSQKKRERAEAEGEDAEGKPKKRRRDRDGEEDDKKWLKLKLEGEEKTKKIKAARIVHYHDYDSGGALFGVDTPAQGAEASGASSSTAQDVLASEPAAPAASAAPPGNFRAGLRLDLWGDDDSEE